MEKFPGWRLMFVAVVIAFGCNVQLAFQTCIINTAEHVFVHHLNESYLHKHNTSIPRDAFTTIWTISVNIFSVGQLFSILLVPVFAEKFGRKGAIMLNNIPSILGTVITALWPVTSHYELLIVGRLIVGFHCGLCIGLQTLYLTEICAAQFRGIFGSFQELFLILIMALSTIIGLPEALGNPQTIVPLLLVPLLPTVLQTLLLFFCPDSPRHLLLSANDEKAAERSISFFYHTNTDIDLIKKLYRKESQLDTPAATDLSRKSLFSFSGLLQRFQGLTRPLRKAIAIGIAAMAAQVLSGIFVLESFSTLIFSKVGMEPQMAKYATVAMVFVNLIAAIIAAGTVERFSRRRLLLGSLGGTIICNCAYVLFASLQTNSSSSNSPFGYVVIVAYFLHAVLFSFGAGPIPWFLTSEMVPQSQRSFAQSVVMFTFCLLTIITGSAYFPLNAVIGAYSFLPVFILPALAVFAVLLVFMPETRGRSTDEIVKLLEKKTKLSESLPAETGYAEVDNTGAVVELADLHESGDNNILRDGVTRNTPTLADGRA